MTTCQGAVRKLCRELNAGRHWVAGGQDVEAKRGGSSLLWGGRRAPPHSPVRGRRAPLTAAAS
eukprot:8753723-Prorocentrum_lima.AAC.1